MKRKFIFGLLLVFVIGVGVEVGIRNEWLTVQEDWYYDLWHQLAGQRYQPQHVAIVAIDDQTRLEYQDEPLVFWSPHFARVISVLRQIGAKVIGLDILFLVSPESWLKKINLPISGAIRTYDLPFRQQLALGKVVLAGDLAIDAQGKEKILLPLPDYWASLPGKLSDVGLAKFYNDPDGVIRRFAPALPVGEGEVWITFAQVLASSCNTSGKSKVDQGQSLTHIGFTGPPGTIPRLSFRQLLVPGAESDTRNQILKDKIIIIAYEPTGEQDNHRTPYAQGFFNIFGNQMSGAELHANIVETIITGRFPRPVARSFQAVYLFALLALGTALFFKLSPQQGLISLGLLALLIAALAYLMFRHYWLVPVAAPQLGLLGCYLGVLGLRLTGEERERLRLRQIFGRYVSEEVVEKMLASGKQPDLGGETLQVTVLFTDIRNFTTMSESLQAQEVVEVLNTYFSRVCRMILEYGGMVDKFIGDAVMAVFGSPVPHPHHARRAIQAALAIAEQGQEFRVWVAQRFPDRKIDFKIGIGLHTGEAVVGNIGSPERFEFTAIGDTVNTASRLEGLTKELGWTIVASSATIEAAGSGVITGGRNEFRVKGRHEPVAVAEVKGMELD